MNSRIRTSVLNLVLACVLGTLLQANKVSTAQDFDSSIIHSSGREYLDDKQNYELTWNIEESLDTITFVVTAKTTGYIGFGLSPNGAMSGSDIFIAGVYENGNIYSSDRHGVGHSVPPTDESSDYKLTVASQNGNYTKIQFERRLNTCDENDYPITDETIRVIWAMGDTDDIKKHAKRGVKSINFYRRDDDLFKPEKYEKIEFLTNSTMPAQHTSYLCTFHKIPPLPQKHLIVAFEAALENSLALEHTHHFVLYRCIAPAGKNPDELFGPFVGKEGKHCYDIPENADEFPIQYCMSYHMYIWSKGGKPLVFPDNVGYPIPDRLNTNEYYAMEVHYDNPDILVNQTFSTGGRIYHNNETREHEAGLLIIDHGIGPQLTVPPNSTAFVVAGHCSSECTDKFIPETGITFFNNLFHSHLKGRKMKLRHFRDGQELPWVDLDNHYDFDFQLNKPLKNSVQIKKGDHLTVECTYQNANEKAIIGGLSSHEEMCEAILFYYPKQKFSLCASEQELIKHMQLFGVTNYTDSASGLAGGWPSYQIIEPVQLAGDYIDSISDKFDWTDDFRAQYQKEKLEEQQSYCVGGDVVYQGVTNYPKDFEEYVPEDECKGDTGSSSSTESSTDNEPCPGCDGKGMHITSSKFSVITLFLLCLKLGNVV